MTPAQAERLKAKVADLRKRLLASPKFQAARAVFATPAGRGLLEELREQFDGDDLIGQSVEETYFNLGTRALFRELVFLSTAASKTAGERTDP